MIKARKVLFIEDSSGDVLLVRQILAELPFPISVSVARDGEQALMILANPAFDAALIILDLNIPKLSGHEVLERNPRKDIPVIVFSGSSNHADIQRALDLGAREYVMKPRNMQAYKDAVLRMIEKWTVPKEDAANSATAT